MLSLVLGFLFFVDGAWAEINVQYPSTVGVGKPFLVRITSTVPLSGATVIWQEKTVPLDIAIWNDKYIALGMFGTQMGKVKQGNHSMKIRIMPNGRETQRTFTIKITSVQYKEDHLTLPESMVTPPADLLARIAAERKDVERALSTITVARQWGLPLIRPVDGIVTSPYGRRRILNKKPRSPHGGVDYRSAVGTPVRAALPGKVILTGNHYYAGKSVYVDSGGGVISLYFHLDSFDVKDGDVISAGRSVGKSGMTGRATGPHLHFGLAVAGQLVNPEPLYETTIAEMLKKSVLLKIIPQERE